MSESGASVQVKRETALALYQKATQLGTAVFKNKNSFLSEVELMWFGGSGDAFPFKLDKELNVCTRMPHQRVFDKFPTAIFPETPAKSKICSAKASNCRCGYVEIRGVNDAEYNVLKTAEYLFQREWVGVVHTSEGAKLYLLPTSQLTHHLGITSPSLVYHRILHGLFVRKEKSEPPSCTTSSSVITPPSAVEQHPSPSTATDITSDQSEQTSSSVALKATPVKRKTVSFADLPVKNDTQNSDNDVIEISPDVAPPPLALATATPEPKPEVKQKEAIIFLSPAIAQNMNIDITALRRTLQCVAVNDGLLAKSLTPARAADKSTVAEKETIPPPQPIDSRDVLSDEESVASSVSSFTSDTSSLSAERPTTRRRRGRGRRGRGRGKAVPNQDASFDAEKGPKTSVRGRNRRRGRGGKSAPELARSASVETVEESIEAGVSDKLFYEDLNKSSVAITRFEQSDVKSTIAHLLSGSSKLESTAPTKPDMTAPTKPIMSAPSELESTAPVSETLEGAVDKGSQKIKQDDFSTSQTPQETKRLDDKAQESASVPPTESPNDTVQPDLEKVRQISTPKIDHESKTSELAPPSQATDSTEKSNVASTPEVVVSEQEVVKPDNKEQDVLDGDIEEEVISEDFELGQVEEYIVLEGSGGQYIRPPKRVSLAEYKRRRTTTDDHLQRRDSTSSESSQTANEKELSLPTQLRVVARADRTAASTDAVLPTATSSEATKEKRLSPLSQAVSEALKAELVSTNMSIKRDKPVTQPVAVGEKKTLKENTAIKEKVSLKSTKVSEKSVVTRGISPVVAPSVGSLTTKEHGSPSPSIASPTSSVQSKDSSSTMQSSGTSAIKFPTQAPSTFISSRVSPYPHHRFGSTAPAHQQPSFPHMLPPHTTLPSHAPSAPTWGYGHLFYPQTGMTALTPQDHWPFGHQFFPPGATQTSNPPLDFPGLRNIGGFDDIPPPPPPRSPDLHMPLLSRSRSISRSRSMSISRSPSRSRSRSRSLTSRSRSRSPLGRLRSRTSRSRSRSRGRSPRRVRSRLSRSPRGRVSRSPRRTSRSPRRTSRSPRRTSRSPRRTSRSPRRTSRSPRRTSRSPRRASLSPRRTSRSPPPDKLNQVILQQISAHFLQSINDKMKKDSAVQASPNISSMGSQIGSGFKHRSISCQTRKPPRRRSRGVQISPRMWNIGSQTVPCRFRTTSSQTHIKKRNVSCQTNFCGATAPLFQALFQNQNFSEFTNILEQAQSNFAKSIGLNVDEFLDDDSDFDESSSSESSGMNIGEEDDASQLNAPSPVISGASNISDGEWSDLEGSNSNSRKESEPPTTPTDHMTTVADARLEPECEMDASTKIQRQNTEQLYPSSLPRDERTFAYGEFCSSHPVNIFSDEQSLPVAKGSGLTTDLNVATVSWQQTDVPLTLPGLSEPSVEDVSHERLQSDTAQHFVLEPTSLTKNTVTASSHEVLPSLHSQKDNDVGSTSTVSNQPLSSYGPALPPGLSPEPAPVTSTPVHGPPLPAPRTTYDVPLPPTYGPPLPPSTLVSDETLSQEEADKESFSGKKVVSVSKEDEASESEGVWQIRSLSLPPFKMSGGSNSNSGQSTPLVSNWSSPLSSPGNDSSKVDQGVKNSWKSVSPPSSSDYPDPSSKLKQRSSESPSANYQKRHTHKESHEQLFKSPSERKRKRKRVNSSPVEKRRKRESLSDDRRHSCGSAEPMEAKDGSPSMEFSSLLGEVRKAASTSPPSHRKFGSEAVLVPVKKKPVLTAQELLEKVRAKRIRSPDENAIKQVGAKSDRSSSESAPESPIITNKQEVLSPPWTKEQMAQVTASSQNPSVNMTQLMMNFHQHMAAKKIRDGSWMHHRPLPPPPPPPPPIGPFIWPPPPPPAMPPTSPPLPPPTVRSTTTTLSGLTPVSSSEKPSTSVASDHFLVSELVQQTNDNSGAVGPAETAHHHSHSPSKQDSEQAKESLNKEEVTKSGDVSTSLSDQSSGNGNSKEQTPSSLDQVVDTNKPDVKEETKSISLTVNLESTSVLDAPCPVPESQINVMYQSSVLDPVSPDDLSNNDSLHSNYEEQCLSSEKDEQEGTLNQDNVRPIDFSSGSDTISESKTSPNVSTAEKDSSTVDSSERTPKDIEVKGSKDVVPEHTSESDLINKPTHSADQFSQACKSTESTVSHPMIAHPPQQPSLSPPESTPPRSFDTVVKSTIKQTSTETCATTERVAAVMSPVDTSPLSEKKDQQRQSQDSIKGSKETASVSAIESSSQDSGASTNPVVASQSKRPAPPSVNVLISKIRSILTNCSVYSEEAKMRAIVEASTEFQKAINQGGSPASSSDLEAKNPKLPPKSPTDLVVKVVDKETVCDEGEADGIHSVKELQSSNSADQPCSDDLKEDKENLTDCIQGMHDASKKDGVNQYPASIDEHSSPEGGQESRDLSPEVLRGKVSEEPSELTDVSGEDFVVSPSPSCSPIKPPSTMCSLRERATRYEFASVAKRDTCLLISHGNGSSDTSTFSCDSLEENDATPGESVTVEASPSQDSNATDSKQIEISNSALDAESANIGTSDGVDLSKLSSENESQEHPTTDEPTQITADQDASGEMVVVADEVEEATCSLSRNKPVGEQETETAVMTETAEKDHIDPASVQEVSEKKEAICKGENEVPAVDGNKKSTAEECDMESIPIIEFKSENMSDTAATVSEETFTTEQSQMDSCPILEKEISPDSKSETVILSDTNVTAEVSVDQCQTKSVLDSENDTKVATTICGTEQGGVSYPADKDPKPLASDEANTPAKTTPTPDDAAAVALATPSTKDDVALPVKSKSSESKSEETMSIVSAMLQAPSKEHIQTAANISTKAPPTRRYPTRYSTRHAAKLATPTTDTSSSPSVSKPSTPALDLTVSPGTNPKVMLTAPPTSQSSSTPSSRVSATLSSLIAPSGKNSPAPAVTFEGLFTLIQALFNRNPQHQLYLSIPTTAQAGQQQSSSASTSTAKQAPSSEIKELLSSLNTVKTTACSKASIPKKASTSHCSSPVVVKEDSPIKAKPLQDGQTSMKAGSGDDSDKDRVDMKDVLSNVGDESEDLSISPPPTDSGEDSKTGDQCSAEAVLPLVKEASRPTSDHTLNPNVKSDESAEVRISEVESAKDPSSTECGLKLVDLSNEIELTEKDTDLEASQDPSPRDTENRSGVYETESEKNSGSAESRQEFIVSCEITSSDQGTDLSMKGQNPTSSDTSDALCEITQSRIDSPVQQQSGESMAAQEVKDKENEEEEPVEFPVIAIGQEKKQIQSELKDVNVECHQDCPIAETSSELTSNIESETSEMPMSSPSEAAINLEECDKGSSHVKSSTATQTRDNPVGSMTENEPVDTVTTQDDNNIDDVKQAARSPPESATEVSGEPDKSAGDFDEGSTSVKSSLSMKPLNVIKSFSSSELQQRKCKSPLFISLPAHYSSEYNKRTIKGPSERYRTVAQGRDESYEPLVVSLPLPLYWRRWEELNSLKVPQTQPNEESVLDRPGLVLSHKGDKNEEDQSSPLVVSFPLKSLQLSTAVRMFNNTLASSQLHNLANIPIVEIYCDEENDGETSESSSSNMFLPCAGGIKQSQSPTDHSHPLVSNFSPALSISPECKTTKRMLIGGHYDEGDEETMKQKNDLKSMLTKKAESPNSKEQLTMPETFVDFLTPTDNVTCEQEPEQEAHIVAVTPVEWNQEQILCTNSVAVVNPMESSPLAPATGEILTEACSSSLISVGSTPRQKLMKKNRLLKTLLEPKTNTEENVATDRPPLKLRLPKPLCLMMSSSVKGAVSSEKRVSPTKSDTSSLSPSPSPKGQSTSKVGPVRRRKRAGTQGEQKRSKDKLKCSKHNVLSLATSIFGSGTISEAKKTYHTPSTDCKSEYLTSPTFEPLPIVLLSDETPYPGHSQPDSVAVQSVPESPTDVSGVKERHRFLPALAAFVKRSKRKKVPYVVSESPSPAETPQEQSSPSLPSLSLLLDTNFRAISHTKSKVKSCGKSTSKSRQSKRSTPVEKSLSAKSTKELVNLEKTNTKKVPKTTKGKKKVAQPPRSSLPSAFKEMADNVSMSATLSRSKSDDNLIPRSKRRRLNQDCHRLLSQPSSPKQTQMETTSVKQESSKGDFSFAKTKTCPNENKSTALGKGMEQAMIDESASTSSCRNGPGRRSSTSNSTAKPSTFSKNMLTTKKAKSVSPPTKVKKSKCTSSEVLTTQPSSRQYLTAKKASSVPPLAQPKIASLMKKSLSAPPTPVKEILIKDEAVEKSRSVSLVALSTKMTELYKQCMSFQKCAPTQAPSQLGEGLKTHLKETVQPKTVETKSLETSVSSSSAGSAVAMKKSELSEDITRMVKKVSRQLESDNGDPPATKRIKLDGSRHSERARTSPMLDSSLRAEGSKSPVKLPDRDRRERRSSSRRGSRASSVTSCSSDRDGERMIYGGDRKRRRSTLEREGERLSIDRERERQSRSLERERGRIIHSAEREERPNYILEMERERPAPTRHPYRSSRELTPPRYRGSSPSYHHFSPRPPRAHLEAWHCRSSILGDPPLFPHPPPSFDHRYVPHSPPPPSRPPPPPPLHHPLPLPYWPPLPGSPPSPYGPPASFVYGRNPYDQRNSINLGNISLNTRYGRYPGPPQERPYDWYSNWRYNH